MLGLELFPACLRRRRYTTLVRMLGCTCACCRDILLYDGLPHSHDAGDETNDGSSLHGACGDCNQACCCCCVQVPHIGAVGLCMHWGCG